MRYAADTLVSVQQTQNEIANIVERYKATGFMNGWMAGKAIVAFEMNERRIRFNLPLPDRTERAFTHRAERRYGRKPKEKQRDPADALRQWEKACRQRWRVLLLIVKAKLEAVESGITSFDEEFLPHIVMANGQTIAERMVPQLPEACATGILPPLLPAGSSETR